MLNCWQCRHSTSGVGQVELGIGVHGQANVAVPHELLGYSGRDTVAGQQGGEGVPQTVNVHGPSISEDGPQ